jgi:hypothetical protein
MGLSDCVDCWSTPCRCGTEYTNWRSEDIEDLIAVLQNILDMRG